MLIDSNVPYSFVQPTGSTAIVELDVVVERTHPTLAVDDVTFLADEWHQNFFAVTVANPVVQRIKVAAVSCPAGAATIAVQGPEVD